MHQGKASNDLSTSPPAGALSPIPRGMRLDDENVYLVEATDRHSKSYDITCADSDAGDESSDEWSYEAHNHQKGQPQTSITELYRQQSSMTDTDFELSSDIIGAILTTNSKHAIIYISNICILYKYNVEL